MRKRFYRGLLFVLVLLIVIIPLSGCKKAQDKLNEEIAEGVAEKYLEGVTGGNADIDIDEGKWPEDMPKKVPEFKAGKIDGATSMTVGETTQISVVVTEVKEKEYNSYAQDLVKAGFEEAMTFNSGGIMTGSYQSGENYISLSFDSESGELIIGYTGNK